MSARGSGLVYAALAAVILIWGTTWAAIRIGLAGVPPFAGVSIRFALAALLLFVASRLLRIAWQGGRRLRWIWASQTVFAFCISYGVVYWAEQWVPSGLTAILFSTFPLFVAVLAHFFLADERLTPAAVVGVLVGFAGVALIFSDDLGALAGRQVQVASLVMLLSPLAAAISNVILKRWAGGIHPVNLTVVPMAGTGFLMGAVSVGFERGETITFDLTSISAILYLAIVGSAVSFTIYYWLLARLPATRLSLITYGIPVVAVLIGWLFMGETVTARTLGGAGLVVLGVKIST